MSRGESFGGGQSSLGYLFEPDEFPTSIEASKTEEPPSDDGKTKTAGQVTQPTKPGCNNYRREHGPNMGNFITGRPSTRVQSAPGGCSSLGYLFGDK